jgi:hypothetical protein
MLIVSIARERERKETRAYGLFSASAEGVLKGGAACKGGDGCHVYERTAKNGDDDELKTMVVVEFGIA